MELPRNIVVEFAGMPKSGKTTVMDVVSHYLRRSGLPVAEFHGGGRYAPLGKGDLGRLNLYLACEVVRYCLSIHAESAPSRIYLLDRGLVDRTLFTDALAAMNRISREHADIIKQLFACPELEDGEDICFVFSTTPQISLARESENKLTASTGRVMNDSFLVALRTAAVGFLDKNNRTRYARKIVGVDTTLNDGAVKITAHEVLAELSKTLRSAGLDIELPERAI